MSLIEIQRSKEGMKRQHYNAEMQVTTGCCIRLAEEGSFSDDATSGIRRALKEMHGVVAWQQQLRWD